MKLFRKYILLFFILSILLHAGISLGLANNSQRGVLKVHFIDVGQGDCTLIQTPDKKDILIDAGNNKDSRRIVAYLKRQGVNKLDIVIGTHPHKDHIGSLDSVLKIFPIGQVVMPEVIYTTNYYRDVIRVVKKKKLIITTAKQGLKLDFGTKINAVLLAPISSNYEDINNYSAVLKLTYNNNTFLFTGDAEGISEAEMLEKGYELKSEVLKVGHHGSSSSTTLGFLKGVSPDYAIISVGKGNDFGHPAQRTLDKLNTEKVKILRTDALGTILFESDGNIVTLKNHRNYKNKSIAMSK